MHTHKILNLAFRDPIFEAEAVKNLGVSKTLCAILYNRGIRSTKDAERFLNVSTGDLRDPFIFSDMQKAVELVKSEASRGSGIMLFGDYDVDGITSLALLKETFQRLGIQTIHALPNRIKEGYGLGRQALEMAQSRHVSLLITADCGISDHRPIRELVSRGVRVIVTDHHQPRTPELPEASAIINPKIAGCPYPFKELAGVGVAYKFCQALAADELLEELDLVSLGTIADVVPLVDENRIIAKEGLLRLARTSRPGLKALIESAGIKNRKFGSSSVSFILGPRINAAGRMGQAEVSFELLMSKNADNASELARIVELHNRQRQKIENKIMEEAEHIINREVNFKEHKVIVIAKEDWHHGVLGIVASKLADRFYRPAIVISLNEELCKGSGRSIKNFHLFRALSECQGLLDSFGGHSHAAGLVITRDNIADFRESINHFAREELTVEDLLPSIDIDAQLGFCEINERLVGELERLEPFGAGNPEPLFLSRSLKLKSRIQELSRDTLKFWVTDGDFTHQVIGFGMAPLKESLEAAEEFDLVYTPRLDTWQGESSLILEAKDIFLK